ncbi:asparagine synthetase B family protein [Sphingomonas faeni]|uniref:asparagine synthetase B family protein n=1 Tax=Sphingomonas faeni TaxID=185950 RepID=UPI00335B97CF
MSAIFGIVRCDGAEVCARTIDRMANGLRHRGPDGCRSVVEGRAGLGHCLMRVTSEDSLERQPTTDHDSLILVADLRLDNREALADALDIAGDVLAAMPDSAVLLAAYRYWGAGCVDRLLGDFAFALWDAAAGTLLLARDPMGQRGLYYHAGAGFFVFASEVKALWAVEGVPRRLSDVAIGARLLFPIDPRPDATLFETIASLPGGTMLRLDAAGGMTTERYWTPHAAPEHIDRDEAYYVATYAALVEEAVACRVRRLARAPGLLFSGGFDSGSIAVLAGPIVAAAGRRIVAVASVLAVGERRRVRDARAAVEAFADRPELDIRSFVRSVETPFADLERGFAETNDPGGGSLVRRGLYRVAADAGVRLVMDGHGGDYTVNVRAPAMLGRILRRGQLTRFAREFAARRRATGRSSVAILHDDVIGALLPLQLIAAVYAMRRRFVPLWRTRVIAEDFARRLFASGAIDPARLRQSTPVHNRWGTRWLHLLRRVSDSPATAQTLAGLHGLELTRPFHDRRVVEFALAIPESLQFRNGVERYLARTAFADRLPASLLARGPGNDAEEPDLFRSAAEEAPAALAAAQALDRDGALSRYVDFAKLAAMITDLDETRLADHRRVIVATLGITTARFVAWFDRTND